MTIHSSILAWRIPWTEDPGGLQSTGLQKIGHDWSDLACMNTHMYILAIVDSSVMNIGVHVSFWIMVFSRYTLRNMIAGSYSTSIFSFLRSIHTVLYNGCAKSLQLCLTLCNPIDGSPPGSPVPGILQARTLEWVAISFSNAWKWKVKVKSLSCDLLLSTAWTAAYQAPPSMGFSRQEYWSGLPLLSPYNGCTGLHFTAFGCSKRVSQFFLHTPTQAIRHMLKRGLM